MSGALGGVAPAGDLLPLADEAVDLADVLTTALDRGVIVHGDVTIAVADIDLIRLNLALLLAAIETIGHGGGIRPASLAGALAGAPEPPGREEYRESGAPPIAPSSAEVGAGAGEVAELGDVARGLPARIDASPPGERGVESGLARLVLTLIEVLRKVLEHQAVRRMEGGRLTQEEVERLGLALARLHDKMQELKGVFGLSDADLEIDLGPLGRLR